MAIASCVRLFFCAYTRNLIHIVKTNMVNILLRYFCFKILSLFTFANYIEKLRLKWLKICKLLVIRNII